MLRFELATSCAMFLVAACGGKVSDIDDGTRATSSDGPTATGGSGTNTVIPSGTGGQTNGSIRQADAITCVVANQTNSVDGSPCVGFSAEPELLQIDPMPCTFALPTLPPGSVINPSYLSVVLVLDSSSSTCIVPQTDADCSQGDGWWMDSSATMLTLCAKACEMINAGAHLEVRGGCHGGPTIV